MLCNDVHANVMYNIKILSYFRQTCECFISFALLYVLGDDALIS